MTERSGSTEITEQLIVAATAGDREAIRRISTVIQPLVARYCRSRLPVDRADDATQEVFLAVLQRLPGYRLTGAPFLAWVYQIAAHKVIDSHRAGARVEPMAAVPEYTPAMGMPITPEAAALHREDRAVAMEAMEALTPRQREVLTLRTMWGMPYADIAVALGMTAMAARVAQHRGLAALRRQLGVSA